MMKTLFRKSLLFFAATFFFVLSQGQQNTLMKQALSDISNFEVMSFFSQGKNMPKKFFVFDTTTRWWPSRFYMEGVNEKASKWARDEHHPYNFSYLFKDSALNKIFSTSQKKDLARQAANLKSRKIQISTPIASTVSSFRFIPFGFIVWATDPVYAADSSYAFIDFVILEKTRKDQKIEEAYHSTVCVIYRKEQGKWKKWKLKKHVIL